MIRKIINALWVLLAVALIAIVVVFVSISKGWIGYMPPVEELEIPIINLQLRYSRKTGKYWVPSQWKKQSCIQQLCRSFSQHHSCADCDGGCSLCRTFRY